MQAILDHALSAHQAGRIEEAYKSYEQHLKIHPQDSIALYGMGSILLSKGQIHGLALAKQGLEYSTPGKLDVPLASQSILDLLVQHRYHDHAQAFLHYCDQHHITLPHRQATESAIQIPSHLQKTAYDHQLQKTLERYRPIENAHYVYAIDIVGGCNLRCPTCPVSNQAPLPKGLMSIDLYQQILTKIRKESTDNEPDIWLFNWTEPLLHPQLEKFIQSTHQMGMSSFISSNLNMGQRLEALMRAQPTRMKVSLSSLKQEIYGQTHARGDIQEVIKNLQRLAQYRDQYQSKTQIWIGHHLYKNTLEEQQEIHAFAQQLGFGYAPSPAIIAPIEQVMKILRQEDSGIENIRAQLLYDPIQIQQNMAQKHSGKKDCELRFNMTTIQYDGLVNLCCATTQSLKSTPVHFLEHAHSDLEAMKYNHVFCKQCMHNHLHLTIPDQ